MSSQKTHTEWLKEMKGLGATLYEYRGIQFHLTGKGYWIFCQCPPKHPYYWSYYAIEGEETTEETMKRAVDRCLGARKEKHE